MAKRQDGRTASQQDGKTASGPRGANVQRWLWWAVLLLALLPACRLVYRAFWGDLGPDPLITIEHGTGYWAFVLLLVTLSITPIRRLTGWNRTSG